MADGNGLTVEEAERIISTTKSRYLKSDLYRFIKRQKRLSKSLD